RYAVRTARPTSGALAEPDPHLVKVCAVRQRLRSSSRAGVSMTRLIVAAVVAATSLSVAQAQQPPRAQATGPDPNPIDLGLKAAIEPAPMGVVQAMCDRLAAATTLRFTAVTTYESPDRTGQPLAYSTLSEVARQRPDKLRVITPGDGPSNEFYYNGQTVQAY